MNAKLPIRTLTSLIAILVAPLLTASEWTALPNLGAEGPEWAAEFAIGGCGGAYFLAEPGDLIVDIFKRDRNARGRVTELRAILFGPDRRVLDEIRLPDDGQKRGSGPGPIQHARISIKVGHKGVYGLNITVSQDRYGEDVIWGLRTNCAKYLIETSRGHRDRRHEEPIVLLGPDRPGSICFLPRATPFRIDVSGLPQAKTLRLFNYADEAVRAVLADDEGDASIAVTADPTRGDQPWRLELPSQQAVVHIDGVTRWRSGELHENLSLWSPDIESFFPFHKYRWLLTPYCRQLHIEPGLKRKVALHVHNNSALHESVALRLETDSPAGTFRLSATHVELRPRRSANVTITCNLPSGREEATCRIRATPVANPDFTTYSTLLVTSKPAPTRRPIDIPLTLEPYRHENLQYGYLPGYPVRNQVYFDLNNRPYVRSDNEVSEKVNGWWTSHSVGRAITTPGWRDRPLSIVSSKIAFDVDNDVYLIGRSGADHLYLHSADGGNTFSATPIPGRQGEPCTFDLEQFSGHNVPNGPPPVVRYTRTASDPKLIWRRVNDLDLFLPTKQAGTISMGTPIRLSDKCIGLSSHSGIPSSLVSHGDRVHVAWGEATDPGDKVPGVPTYVVTVDRTRRSAGTPSLVGHGPPANDIHNSPSITIDSKGYLHVLVGTHGRPFPYSRSLQPHDASKKWTAPVPVGDGRQTYIGLVCDAEDTLHLVCRMWRYNLKPHPLSSHASLVHQAKRQGQPWSEPSVLIVAPFSEYSIFYHRLTIDRTSRLFLSYDYWSTYWYYRTDHRGDRRALLMSPDNGDTWKLVEDQDLIEAQ